MKVVIVGGGIAGLSIGWRLVKAGCEVVVLERAAPGRGATWASAGMIAATVETAETVTQEAQFARRSAEMWPAFAAEIEARSGRPIYFRRDGALIIAASADAFGKMSARDGVSLLSGEEARRLEPMLRGDVAGALWAKDEGQVDSRAVGIALALAFVADGGTLQINESAVCLEYAGGAIAGMRTPFALYQADAYVLAAGAWSGTINGIAAAALPPINPVKGEMIALAPPPGAKLPTRLVWGNEIYLVPRRDRLLVGATMSREGFDTATTEAAENWLLSHARMLMPGLSTWDMVEHWAGLRPGSPDDLPLLGETTTPGLFVASGQYRNGILFAPAIADAMHSLILEHRQPPDIRAFDPKRFAGHVLAVGNEVR